MRFWIPWGIAAIVTGVVVLFFVLGLADGTVSSFNAGLWTLLLLATFGVTAGSLVLKTRGRPGSGPCSRWSWRSPASWRSSSSCCS